MAIVNTKFNCRNVIFLEGMVRNINVSDEGKLYFILESVSLDKFGGIYKCPIKVVVAGKAAVSLLTQTIHNGDLVEVEGKLRWSEESDTYKVIGTHVIHTTPIMREVELKIDEVKHAE